MSTEDTDATNELINDGDSVQPLTLKEIEELKNSGTHASVRNLFSDPVIIYLTISPRK